MDDHDGYPGASPRIARLRSALMADGTGATERFWRDVAERGAPLVEPLADGRTALVTFVWRGAGELRNVAVLGSLMGLDAEQNQLAHLAGSDVWYRTYQLPMAARGRYWFSPDDPLAPLSVEHWDERIANWRRGPRNPATFRDPWYLGEADVREVLVSVLSLPDAPAQPWGKEVPGVPAGMLAEHMVRSVLLGNARRVWVYTPAGYAAGELGAVVFLDGHAYAYAMSAPTVLDNLIAAGRIPPLVAVFVDSLGHRREVELPCYPPFADFLADELLPWAREHYRITASPERTVVGGSSFGGLAAAFAGLRRPDAVGNVLAQSGSFWWAPEADKEYEWLARRFAEEPVLPLRFYLDVGLLEAEPAPPAPSQLLANRHLRTVLRAKGYAVRYAEFSGGHDEVCWRGTLADGLIALVSNPDDSSGLP